MLLYKFVQYVVYYVYVVIRRTRCNMFYKDVYKLYYIVVLTTPRLLSTTMEDYMCVWTLNTYPVHIINQYHT